MRATDQQVQNFADGRVRPRAEQLRALYLQMKSDQLAAGDILTHLSGANGVAPTWQDGRMDGPPLLLEGEDLLAYHELCQDLIAFLEAHLKFNQVLTACVRPPLG